jgi:hypothetical protein
MVGSFGDPEGVVHDFVLSAGQFTTVTIAGSPWSELRDLNSQGTAVGDFFDDSFTTLHGFMYDIDGTITYLPNPVPGTSSSPSGINNRGAVTGFYAQNPLAPSHGYNGRGRTVIEASPGSREQAIGQGGPRHAGADRAIMSKSRGTEPMPRI